MEVTKGTKVPTACPLETEEVDLCLVGAGSLSTVGKEPPSSRHVLSPSSLREEEEEVSEVWGPGTDTPPRAHP